jgi:hypothetical protein
MRTGWRSRHRLARGHGAALRRDSGRRKLRDSARRKLHVHDDQRSRGDPAGLLHLRRRSRRILPPRIADASFRFQSEIESGQRVIVGVHAGDHRYLPRLRDHGRNVRCPVPKRGVSGARRRSSETETVRGTSGNESPARVRSRPVDGWPQPPSGSGPILLTTRAWVLGGRSRRPSGTARPFPRLRDAIGS